MTATSEPKRTFGLVLSCKRDSTGDYVIEATLGSRQEGGQHPRGISDLDCGYDTAHALDGLTLRGWVSTGLFHDRAATFIGGTGFEYYHVYSIGQRRAEAMAKTLRKLNARIRKDGARSPGEVLLAVARCLKLEWVCCRPKRERASSYDEGDWNWYGIGDGKQQFEHLIETTTREAEEERLGSKVPT